MSKTTMTIRRVAVGHTAKVQERHYLRVLDSFYDKAVEDAPTSGKPRKFTNEPRGNEIYSRGNEMGNKIMLNAVNLR